MLTDLPQHAIDSLHKQLGEIGHAKAWVLVEEKDDLVEKFGQSVFNRARDVIDALSQQMGLSAKIYVGLIIDEQRDFQACAARLSKDEYCILIWVGAANSTLVSISRLLNTTVSAELFSVDIPVPHERATLEESDTFKAYRELSLLSVLDLGENLNDFRNRLALSALEWLVLHEFGHIVNGHLALGETISGMTYILENDPKNDRDKHITDQALEFDADCFANQFALRRALGRPLPGETADAADRGELIGRRFKSYVFAIMAIIRGFDRERFDVETLFNSDHPPGGVRMGYLLDQIAAFESGGNIDFSGIDVKDIAAKTAVSVERAIWEATGIHGNGGNLWAAMNVSEEQFRLPVLSRWAKIHPALNAAKLNPFKLAEPQYEPA
ncbi:hypothetical protein [Rhizobium leguminosarum]